MNARTATVTCPICGDALGLAWLAAGVHGDCEAIHEARGLVEQLAAEFRAAEMPVTARRILTTDHEQLDVLLSRVLAGAVMAREVVRDANDEHLFYLAVDIADLTVTTRAALAAAAKAVP